MFRLDKEFRAIRRERVARRQLLLVMRLRRCTEGKRVQEAAAETAGRTSVKTASLRLLAFDRLQRVRA